LDDRPRLVVDPSFLNAVNTSIIPSSDNAYDLGSLVNRWKNVIISANCAFHDGTDYCTGIISRTMRCGHDFLMARTGSGDYTWKRALVVYPTYLIINHLGDFTDGVRFGSTIAPYGDNAYDLGTTSLRWRDLYVAGTSSLQTTVVRSYLQLSAAFSDPTTLGYIDVIPYDNTKNATLRIFRNTNTSGDVSVHFFKGDNTATITCSIDAKNGSASFSSYLNCTSLKVSWTEVISSDRVLSNIASVNQTLSPTTDNAYDLGSSSYRWRNAILSGYVNPTSLQIGGTEVINSSRVLKNITDIDTVDKILQRATQEQFLFWFCNHWLPSGMVMNGTNGGSVSFSEMYVTLNTGSSSGTYSYVYKRIISKASPGYTRKTIFSVVIALGSQNALISHIVVGEISSITSTANTAAHIGFKIIDDQGLSRIYGTVANGTTESTVSGPLITSNAICLLTAIHDPSTGTVTFYRDESSFGSITTNIPTGSVPNYKVFNASIAATTTTAKSLNIYEVKYYNDV